MLIVTIIAFLVILTVLVLIHEFGHFITAKIAGIKVEEFGFGFPPRAFGIKRGETVYSVNWLPIGGFVKLYGEDEAGGGSVKQRRLKTQEKYDLRRAFFARPSWQKAIIVLAGVVMNFVLAVVLISFLFSSRGVALPTENIKIVEVTHNSPAEAAGIKTGDQVVLINNKHIAKPDDFITLTHENEGNSIALLLRRNGNDFTINVIPRKTFPKGQGPLGVAITNVEIKKYPWFTAPFYGTLEAAKFSWMILTGIGSMVFNLIIHGQKPVGVVGPVGVAELTGQAVSYGFDATLWFVALLSLNLAVVNVLPIPALDGGRLFFILIEMITRRKVSPKHEAMAHAVGLAVLLSLVLLITLFDVARLIAGQSLIPQM